MASQSASLVRAAAFLSNSFSLGLEPEQPNRCEEEWGEPASQGFEPGSGVIGSPECLGYWGDRYLWHPNTLRGDGATPEGKKELVGLIDGVRESVQSWRELLLDLRRRGLSIGPELAVADGALGFWQALEEVWPKTRSQRCWVHKTVNVLNKLPKSLQAKATRALQDIWMAETKKDALIAFDAFVETYGVKYDKAVACLVKDRDALLAFYDFPAEHWKHLRTTNPIESTFATIRHRTVRSKGCLSNKTALALIFKLAQAAEKSWRRLDGHHHLPKVIRGVTFTDGIEDVSRDAQPAAA